MTPVNDRLPFDIPAILETSLAPVVVWWLRKRLQNLALFHGLGCAVLLGASRKRFIGTIGGAESARHRAPGSVAVALAGVAQGVQLLRIHDVSETAEALRLWQAATLGRLP